MSERNTCDCGGALSFDATREGTTCGGLHLIGALVCGVCKSTFITKRSVTGGGKWTVASSGRSLVADGVKLRSDKTDGDLGRLLARIARLPDLEAALCSIARGAAEPAEIARRALECPYAEPGAS